MTLPNILSFTRILLVPIIFVIIMDCTSSRYPWLLGIYASAVFLDFLDGFIARRLAMESELGRILDPVADKLLIFFSIVALTIVTDFPVWMAIPIVFRDIVILLASSMLYKRKHLIKGSIALGKITFFLLTILIYVYIIDINPQIDLHVLKQFFLVLSLGFILWSFEEYFLVYKRVKGNE